jgi:hypothetical protein
LQVKPQKYLNLIHAFQITIAYVWIIFCFINK